MTFLDRAIVLQNPTHKKMYKIKNTIFDRHIDRLLSLWVKFKFRYFVIDTNVLFFVLFPFMRKFRK